MKDSFPPTEQLPPPAMKKPFDHTCTAPACPGGFDCELYKLSRVRMRVIKMVPKEDAERLQLELSKTEEKYNELIMQVETKIEGKSRHEAAIDMIRRGEACMGDCGRCLSTVNKEE